MNTLLCAILIMLVLYFEWVLVKTMLTPLIDIAVCLFFICVMLGLIVAELALIIIGPIALVLGVESRTWHTDIAKGLMTILEGKKNDDAKRTV